MHLHFMLHKRCGTQLCARNGSGQLRRWATRRDVTLCVAHRPQVEHPVTKQVTHYWFESPKVAKPFHEHALGDEGRCFPRDCREAVRVVWRRARCAHGRAAAVVRRERAACARVFLGGGGGGGGAGVVLRSLMHHVLGVRG
jgi:hypothetical protein